MNTETFQTYYTMLNSEQKEAVDTLDGPVMVIAGPGTGKTQIISTRTANIILKTGVDPSNILITTFTEAGVTAIRERLISMIGTDAYKVHIATIHSFSQDVIKTFPEKFTVEKLDTPIDEIESLEILSGVLSDFISEEKLEFLTTYGDPMFYLREIKRTLSHLKREGIPPRVFETSIADEEQKSLAWLEEKRNNTRIKKIEKYEQEHEKKIGKLRELHAIYLAYNETLRARHVYDFDDMIQFVLDGFENDETLRSYYAETYQYIMLDEYQDTNNSQNQIISQIMSMSESSPNIMVVGDDDQSIYRFQGANIENMLDFTTLYPEAKIIVLDKNYRSQQYILDGAKNLIEENSERLINRLPSLSKDLHSQVRAHLGTSQIQLYQAPSDVHERLGILNQIQSLIADGVSPDEIAVIVRNNAEISSMSEFLQYYDIPTVSKLENNILDNEFLGHIFTFLRFIDTPYASETGLLNILRSDLVDIDSLDILKITNYLYRKNFAGGKQVTKLFDILGNDQILTDIGVEYSEKIQAFRKKFLESQRLFAQHNIQFALGQFMEVFDIFHSIKTYGNMDDIQDVYSFFHVLRGWTKYIPDMSIATVMNKIDLYKNYGYRIEREVVGNSPTGIQIVTAHSSKGLEYEHVFIPGLSSGNWDNKYTRKLITLPESLVGDGLQFAMLEEMSEAEKKNYYADKQLQEDRRLFFVAVTRAKTGLYLSFPMQQENKLKIISPFVGELGEIRETTSEIAPSDIEHEMVREMIARPRLIGYKERELEYIENFMKDYRLSASDLNSFLVDPEHFLLSKVFKYPFEQNENSLFGTMYHRTLELFYKKILDSGEIPGVEYMKEVFMTQLEREYLTQEEYNRLKKRGYEGLEGYYTTYQGNFGIPLKTEYKFSRKNSFFEDIPITGIIDKIELVDETYIPNPGVGESTPGLKNHSLFSQAVRIIDYKTGSIKYSGEIKGVDKEGNPDLTYEKGRFGRQLMFYKLLFENTPELYQHYSLEGLAIDFCEGKNGKYTQTEIEFSEEEYENFKKLVQQTYTKMTDMNFWKEFLDI